MEQKIRNKLQDLTIEGNCIAGNQTNNYTLLYQESEREFVVTRNANIKPVSYFIGRETELEDLRQRIEEGRKSVLVSGMGGVGKTQICRKLFHEYKIKNGKGKNGSFSHIGYIEYDGDMNSSLQNCLMFKKQDSPEKNLEAAWQELNHLAADGKLLLFVDNVSVSIRQDVGLERLKQIPSVVILTSRRTFFSKEFESYRIGFLDTEQCKVIYEKIRYKDTDKKVSEEEIPDLEYVIEEMAAWHTITVEFVAHLAETKHWNVKKLRSELEGKGFRLEYKDEEDKLINIQEEYEKLYDLSGLTKAEQNILEAFSIFPYIPLAAETCNEWLLTDAGISEEDDILIGLYRKGWLQFDVDQEGYALHPVFAQFIYERCKPVSSEKHQGLIESCKMSLQIPESGSALECQKYIPFAENMIEKIGMRDTIKKTMFMIKLACLLQYIAEYQKAKELYEKSLRINEKVLGKEHLNIAIISYNLAEAYLCQERYESALTYFAKSYKISVNKLGFKHPDTKSSFRSMAIVYATWNPGGDFKQWLEEKMKQ